MYTLDKVTARNGHVTLTDNGGTANGGVDTQRRADLHDHGQRRE